MQITDLDKVVFYSKEDLASEFYLQKGERILRTDIKSTYTDINEVLELYNLKKYIDCSLYLKSWSQDDIANFKKKATEYGKVVGKFMNTLDYDNIEYLYENIIDEYTHSFWELVNNQHRYKCISKHSFVAIIAKEPYLIHEILTHNKLVEYYSKEIRNFLLSYSKSAEILLSIYEELHDFKKDKRILPTCLTINDKEKIISEYLDSDDVNYNYLELILNAKRRSDFIISDKTRLKAKRLHKSKTDMFFSDNKGITYGASITFNKTETSIKSCRIDGNIFHYSYNLDYIEKINDLYMLYRNFQILFEYVDDYNRITLVRKIREMDIFETQIGVRSQNEYSFGIVFSLSEMISNIQILGYSKMLTESNISLESILHFVFTSAFQAKYDFANNARFSAPTATSSYFEKVRLIAPEFESILKQYKLYVEEDKVIDFELLQISSAPSAIKDIPSLNKNKYIYFNEGNKQILGCYNLIFSDQTTLTYIEPFKNKRYHSFFDLLANEDGKVKYSDYAEYQRIQLQYLMDNGFISVDKNDVIQVINYVRLLILKDLYDNEVASYYHYPTYFQEEVMKMKNENIVDLESSLFSKPEQSYFNYILNKSEFTNSLDLRNSYLHGTQANPDEKEKHKYAYFIYLKLLFLTMLKIEDDLFISKMIH